MCCCCGWLLLYSAILHSLADSLRSRVILHEWLAFYCGYLNIHWNGVLIALTFVFLFCLSVLDTCLPLEILFIIIIIIIIIIIMPCICHMHFGELFQPMDFRSFISLTFNGFHGNFRSRKPWKRSHLTFFVKLPTNVSKHLMAVEDKSSLLLVCMFIYT